MKNFNLLRKSERKSVGTTLALTVGSPSFDRRGTMLKHLTFMLLFLLGSLSVWGDPVEIYKNEGSSGTTSGVEATGNVNTNSSNGNPGSSFANTSSKNTTFIFTGFNVSGYTDLTLSLDVAFKNFPATTNTFPYATITFYKNDVVVKTDNSTISWTEKVSTYSTKTISNIPNFDKIQIVCSPAIGKTGKGANATNYGLYMDNITLTGTSAGGGGGGTLSHTWDLSTNSYIAASTDQVTWSSTKDVENAEVKMIVEKGTAGTAANDYLGGTNSHTSSRFYQNSILKIMHTSDVTITSVVFTATTEADATALQKSDWTNAADATASGTTVTVTPNDPMVDISAPIGKTCDFKGVTVYYTDASAEPEPVIVKTLKSIAVEGMTTTFEQGDVFNFDGTCTATYGVTKDGVPQADENKTVTPTSVSTPDMTTSGNKTITVSYTENAVTKTTTYDITVSAAAPVIVSAIEDIEDGASYYIRGVRSSGSVVEYLKFTDGTKGATISGTSASSMDQAIAITFNKVSDGVYQLVTPKGLYVQPGASNGKISLSESATTCTLSNTTKSWDNSATIAISTVDGSSNTWIIQKNTGGTNFGGYKNSQYDVTLVLASAAATVAKPTISGETPFLSSTTVTISHADADAIYYTTDGSDPKKSGAKLTYSAPFTVNADGTTTVKAYAVKGGDESAVAEKTFTKITPLTVAQALGEAAGSGKYVTGTITSITEVSVANGNATYVISDISAGVKQNEMIVYRGKYVGGANFTSADQIHVGDVVVVSGSISQYKSVNQMAQGNQIETISAAAVAAPEFTPNGGGFVVSTDVTITCATAGNAIYYTTDGTSPTKSSTLYEGAIHLDATTTINAIAYIGEESSLVVEKTFTLTAPMTVAEACAALGSEDPINNAAVSGIVYQVDHCTAGGNATYWISDDGTNTGSVLEVFNGYGLNGAAFVENGIRVGDEVVVFGNLTIFNTTIYEFSASSRLLSLTRKTVQSVAVTGTPTKTNYKVGDAFDPAGLTVTVTYNDASHATVAVADCGWEITPATFDAAGTGLSVNVKATYDGVQSPAFAVEGLNVKAVPTFGNSNYEWQLVTSDAQLVAGKYYVIAYTANNHTMKYAANGNYYETVSSTVSDGAIAYDALGENTAIFELGGSSSAWTFTEAINEVVLGATTSKNMSWGNNTTWTISIDKNNASIANINEDCGILMYNNSANPKRFKVYASTSTMPLPQLYVWALKTNKLRYDANGGKNAPAAQAADGEGKATVTDAKPTKEDYIFKEWNTLVDGNGEAKVAGDVIDLSAGDVTLYAQWREPNTYSISYDANGGTLIEGESEITPTSVTEGNAYTIEENVYEVEGKLFIGWKANGVTYNAGQEIYPTEDMAFVAQWGDPNVTDFMLVTDVKQLKDGDKVYIVAADYNVAMGTQNDGNYRNYVEITKQNNRVVILNATPIEFTVGKDGDNFTFKDGEGYLYASSSDKNYLITKDVLDDNGKWAISINANGVASIIAQGTNTNKNLKWNNSSPRFSCYASGQKAVSIYKRPDYTRNVSGNYATICLPKAGKIIGATLYEIAYYGGASKKIFFDEIVNGEMEAGIPYIFQPAAGVEKINVYYSDNTAEDVVAGNRNGLIGFYDLNDPAATHNITQDAGFYILYNNQYWLVSGRAAYVENYRAYIELNQIDPSEPTLAPGRRRISMSVNDTQTATGFENVQGDNGQCTKVLINGELFILRGEKMYDAKGQLVK